MKRLSIYSFIEQYAPQYSAHLAEHDYALLTHIETLAPKNETLRTEFFKEFLNGAYVFIPDDGESYDVFSSIEEVELINRNHSSSHDSIDTQYAFRSHVLGECLFGTRELDSQKGTWIQLEAYHTSLTHLPAHLYTYAVYVVTGENSGPMGKSSFTEKTPYMLDNTADCMLGIESELLNICLLEFNEPVHSGVPITLSEVLTETPEIDLMPTQQLLSNPTILPTMTETTMQSVLMPECL